MKKLTTRTRLHNDLGQISSVFIVKRNISMQVSKTLQNWSAKKNLSRNFDWMPSSSFQFLLHFGRFFVLCLVILSFLQIQYFLWGLSPIKSCMSPPFPLFTIVFSMPTILVYFLFLEFDLAHFAPLVITSLSLFRLDICVCFFTISYPTQLPIYERFCACRWSSRSLPLPHLVINNYKGPFWKLLTSSCSFSRFDIDWMHSQF